MSIKSISITSVITCAARVIVSAYEPHNCINKIYMDVVIIICGLVSLVVSNQSFETGDLDSNPVQSTRFNQAMTAGK